MRLSLRFIIPLVLALAALAYSVMPLVDRLTQKWFIRDLNLRASLVANSIDGPLENLANTHDSSGIRQFFARITQDERLFAMGFCPIDGTRPIATPTLPREIQCADLDRFANPASQLLTQSHGPLLVSVLPLGVSGSPIGNVVILHYISLVPPRS